MIFKPDARKMHVSLIYPNPKIMEKNLKYGEFTIYTTNLELNEIQD